TVMSSDSASSEVTYTSISSHGDPSDYAEEEEEASEEEEEEEEEEECRIVIP
ncbi:hypothetical protein Tco_0549690, partial [Tanacetum coccineum]